MGLTTALNTSLNGLALNETAIEVIGNNIANAGTNGFKASTVEFTTQLARTLSVGSEAQGANGGTNPRQIGLGATTAAIRRDNSQGAITTSTSPSDLAIEGAGFFILDGTQGQVYSRNGNFTLNKDALLVNAQGLRVQGYGVDDQFNIVKTEVSDLNIPLIQETIAQETTKVAMEGSLLTDGNAEIATQRGIIETAQMTDAGNSDADIVATTLLSDVQLDGQNVFTVGETINYTPIKGEATYPEESFAVTATSEVGDFMTFLSDLLGLDTANGAGVAVTGGQIQITSNAGRTQDISIPAGNELTQSSGGANLQLDLEFDRVQSADGEGAVATFAVYDSLGEQLTVRMHTVVEATTPTTQVRYYLESADDSDRETFLGSGTFDLDAGGAITGNSVRTFTINRGLTAANDLSIDLDLSDISGLSNSNSLASSLNLKSQDGAPPGALSSFNINDSGVINGVFDNGIIRPLGQILLAQFANELGLVESGNGTFREGISSGVGRHLETRGQALSGPVPLNSQTLTWGETSSI